MASFFVTFGAMVKPNIADLLAPVISAIRDKLQWLSVLCLNFARQPTNACTVWHLLTSPGSAGCD